MWGFGVWVLVSCGDSVGIVITCRRPEVIESLILWRSRGNQNPFARFKRLESGRWTANVSWRIES